MTFTDLLDAYLEAVQAVKDDEHPWGTSTLLLELRDKARDALNAAFESLKEQPK